MDKIAKRLKDYIEAHPFDPGDSDCETVLDQLYQAYAESHESDPTEISDGFKDLEEFLCNLPLDENNAVFNLCCRLCKRPPCGGLHPRYESEEAAAEVRSQIPGTV